MRTLRVLTCLSALWLLATASCQLVVPPQENTASLRVVNNSSLTIYYLRISPSSQNTWGPDQLGSNVLRPGNSFTVTSIPCDRSYDFRVEGVGNVVLAVRYNVYLACGQTFTWTLVNAGLQGIEDAPASRATTGAAKQLETPGTEAFAKPAGALRVDEAALENHVTPAPAPLSAPGPEGEAAYR
ncbi:MAG TPA: hypothetical protein VH877_04850 [Polyangia bacterium]|jgi:hypothetical protein|nr:hypothetical protein [Polyangia bacterium]